MTDKKKFLLDLILAKLREGKNPSTIAKELGRSKQNTEYYLKRLRQEGIIKKVGYGTWEVKNYTSSTLSERSKNIRGHAFIWKLRVPKEIGESWMKRLKAQNIDFKLVSKSIPRIFIKNQKVWLGKKNIVIYENKAFYGQNSINARKYAVIGLLEIVGALESKLKVNLRPYVFKPSREHYGMIKNELARQCNRKKEKIIIRDNLEGQWLWIDDSESLSELETGGPKAMIRSKQVQDWWNDHKKNNFEVKPSFVVETLGKVAKNQEHFSENFNTYGEKIKAHTKAMEKLEQGINKWADIVEKVRKDNEKLKQRRLNEFY